METTTVSIRAVASISRGTRRVVLVASAFFSSAMAGAQDASVNAGDRIRARTFYARAWTYGTLVSFDTSALQLQRCAGCEVTTLSVLDVTQLDVSLGRTGRSYALVGLVIGAVAGAVYLHWEGQKQDARGPNDICDRCNAVTGTVSGVLAGGLLGAAVGALVRQERWSHVQLRR